MVGHTAVVQPGNSLNSLLSGKVVIQVTMDENILLQFNKALFQIADGVHHNKVGRVIYANMEVAFSMKFHIREKIHETLENTDVTLDNINIAYRECGEDLDIYNGNDVLHANMDGYPEITRVSHSYFISHELSAYHDMPVYGLYLYNVENVQATSFRVAPRSVNTRPFTNAGTFDERDGKVNSSVSTDF